MTPQANRPVIYAHVPDLHTGKSLEEIVDLDPSNNLGLSASRSLTMQAEALSNYLESAAHVLRPYQAVVNERGEVVGPRGWIDRFPGRDSAELERLGTEILAGAQLNRVYRSYL